MCNESIQTLMLGERKSIIGLSDAGKVRSANFDLPPINLSKSFYHRSS